MKLLWFTWKDLSHPRAGGAEVVNEELAKRLVADGHEVAFIVSSYPGAPYKEVSPYGYEIIRLGNRYTVFWKAFRYYRQHLRNWPDLVIDEVNTMPFFATYYASAPTIVFAHMLCRRIWFYQLPLPIGLVGYLLEPLYLRLINSGLAVTVSASTKQALIGAGFKAEQIHVISEGISIKPFATLPPLRSKAAQPTILSFGAMRAMKRTLHQIQAFEIAKQAIPDLQLAVAGDSSGKYGQKVLAAIKRSPYSKDITYHGRVSEDEKTALMRTAHLTLQTSIKEGWGLTVTEAASQGTPAAVYNADGLRDSVRDGKTGLITKQNNPQQLAEAIVTLLTNQAHYTAIREAGWQWSKTITFDKSYQDFLASINGSNSLLISSGRRKSVGSKVAPKIRRQ